MKPSLILDLDEIKNHPDGDLRADAGAQVLVMHALKEGLHEEIKRMEARGMEGRRSVTVIGAACMAFGAEQAAMLLSFCREDKRAELRSEILRAFEVVLDKHVEEKCRHLSKLASPTT